MKPTKYQILGPLEIRAGVRILELGGHKQRSLLAILLIHANEVISADRLITELWGEYPPEGAQNTLQSYVSRLRKALSDDGSLQTRPPGYQLLVAPDRVDSRLFESMVAEGSSALRIGDTTGASVALNEALALWSGNALADFIDEPFAHAEAIRLEELKVGALEMKFEAELALGKHMESVADLEVLVRTHPLRERLWEHLILALYRCGRQADALDAYARAQRMLAEELGLEPGSDLQRLQERILNHDVSLERRPLEDQRLEESVRRHNLPSLLTSFVGRTHELGELKSFLFRSRLVTLTGVGGAGKSRLALKAGEEVLADHPDGVWLVKLESIDIAGEVIRAVAKVFGVPHQPDRSLLDVLTTALETKRALLILDECEHVVKACAELASALLAECPYLRILATSREALGVGGETVLHVPPLPVPPSDDLPLETLGTYESFQLFVERSASARPGVEITPDNAAHVAHICRQVDGIPLALELAATRVSSLGFGQIAQRLEDRLRMLTQGSRVAPSRQVSLQATLDWSFHLLDQTERVLFRRLSSFSGGFSLEAAEAVCAGEPITERDVIDLLGNLVAKSLVMRTDEVSGAARFHLLETVRQYATERIHESGEFPGVRKDHAIFFTTLAEEADAALRGPDQAGWLDRLELEHDNLRAAFKTALDLKEVALGLRLASALWWYWDTRSYPMEGAEWVRLLLPLAGSAPRSVRARALAVASALVVGGTPDRGIQYARQSLDLASELNDDFAAALALHRMAWGFQYQGDYVRAADLLEECLELFERIGAAWEAAYALHHLAMVARLVGDYERARTLHEESLATFRARGDNLRVGYALWTLAVVGCYQGDYENAARMCEEALPLLIVLKDRGGAAHVRYTMGDIARLQGDLAKAVLMYESSLGTLRDIGDLRCVASTLRNLGIVAQERAEPSRAEDFFMKSLRIRLDVGDKAGISECLEGLAALRTSCGDSSRAIKLMAAAETLRTETGSVRPVADQSAFDREMEIAQKQLEDGSFATLWNEGAAMSLESATSLAASGSILPQQSSRRLEKKEPAEVSADPP